MRELTPVYIAIYGLFFHVQNINIVPSAVLKTKYTSAVFSTKQVNHKYYLFRLICVTNILPLYPVVQLLSTCSLVPITSFFRRLAAVVSFAAAHSDRLHRRRNVRLSSDHLESS